eukprot:c12041_g1_i3 orf=128-1009(+)
MGETETCVVVVVGGSIAGLCCALSLLHHHSHPHHQAGAAGTAYDVQAGAAGPSDHHYLQAGSAGATYHHHLQGGAREALVSLHVVVLEKAQSLTAAGAGLGLDTSSAATLLQWGLPLLSHTLPLSSEENRVVHGTPKRGHTVARDQEYNNCAMHWSDLHRMLYDALPAETVKWNHEVISYEEEADGKHVKVHFRKGSSPTIDVMQGNLLIAADGAMSKTRKRFLPHEERRYCGYCAWRGVLDASTEEGLKLKAALRQQYPDLGHCLYFDIAENTHAVLYELAGNRLNWLWVLL